MKCAKCGKEIPNDSKFCQYCADNIELQTRNREKSERKTNILLTPLLIAIVAAALIIVALEIIQTCEIFKINEILEDFQHYGIQQNR